MTTPRRRRPLPPAPPPSASPAPPPAGRRPRRTASRTRTPARPRRRRPGVRAGSSRGGLGPGGPVRHARGGCGPWASSASSRPCSSGSRPAWRSGPPTAPWPGPAANTDQLVRIQAIQTNVVQADADATNAFLVGGLEPAGPARGLHRGDRVRLAADRRGRAAPAGRRDRRWARSTRRCSPTPARSSRPGPTTARPCPIGAQYLRDASADLRADALPLLTNLVEANNARVDRGVRPRRTRGPVARRRRAAHPGRARARPGLAGPADPPLRQRPAGGRRPLVVLVTLVVGAVGLAGRRSDVDDDPRRRLRRHAVHGAGPDRRVRRQVEREPDADRPRLRGGVREGLAGLGRAPSSAELAELGQQPGVRRTSSPLPWADYADGPPADPRARRLRATGTARSSWPPAPAPSSGNATFAALRHQLRRSSWPP